MTRHRDHRLQHPSLFALAAGLVALAAAPLAQASGPVGEHVVHPFGLVSGSPQNPHYGSLVQGRDGSFYGMSQNGGLAGGYGTAFSVAADGTYTLLHSFSDGTDGADPERGLALASNGLFYGVTSAGSGTRGTAFRMNTAGTLVPLHQFDNASGGAPDATLVQSADGSLWGTAPTFGTEIEGTVYRILPDGVTFQTVVSFDCTTLGNQPCSPDGGLILGQDGNFYGVADAYENSAHVAGYGAVYRVTPAGVISTVYGFMDPAMDPPSGRPARDAAGNIYVYGGTRNSTMVPKVYRISPAGALSVLYSFDNLSYICTYGRGDLLLHTDGRLYGTAGCGGANGAGFVFSLTTDGVMRVLHDFDNDGVDVHGDQIGLTPDKHGGMWSMSGSGGPGGWGGAYRLDAPTAKLTATPANPAVGAKVTLKWSSTNSTDCAASGGWTGALATSGKTVVTAQAGATSYGLTCSGAGSVAKAVVVTSK